MAQENEEANEPQDVLQQYQIVGRKQWEHRYDISRSQAMYIYTCTETK